MKYLIAYSLFFSVLACGAVLADDDPYLWLEEVQDEKALDWVRGQNASTFEELRENDVYEKFIAQEVAYL